MTLQNPAATKGTHPLESVLATRNPAVYAFNWAQNLVKEAHGLDGLIVLVPVITECVNNNGGTPAEYEIFAISPRISFSRMGDEYGAVLVMAFGFKQETQRFRVLVGIKRRFRVARIGSDPAGMDANDVQARIVFEVVAQGHGEHIQGGLLCSVIQVEGAVASPDAAPSRTQSSQTPPDISGTLLLGGTS